MDKLPKDLKLLVVQKAHLIWVRKQKQSKPVYHIFDEHIHFNTRHDLYQLLEVDALVYYGHPKRLLRQQFTRNLVSAELCSRLGMPLSIT